MTYTTNTILSNLLAAQDLSGSTLTADGCTVVMIKHASAYAFTPPDAITVSNGGSVVQIGFASVVSGIKPAAGDILSGVSAGDVDGTMPSTATTQAADAATLEAVKASLKNRTTVTFGASSVTGTMPVNMRPHYRRKAKR